MYQRISPMDLWKKPNTYMTFFKYFKYYKYTLTSNHKIMTTPLLSPSLKYVFTLKIILKHNCYNTVKASYYC